MTTCLLLLWCFTDGQYNLTTITPEETITQSNFPLPIFQVDIDKIDVHLPHEFNSVNGPNVRPSRRYRNIIRVHYDL